MFESHHRRVLGYALRRVAVEADAEDVVAETFAIAWRKIRDAPATPYALPWLFAIARRVIANQRRGATRGLRLVERLKDHFVAQRQATSESPVLEALGRLRAEEQELLRLIAWDGLGHAEAGAVLGITANAVAIRLYGARRRLSDELARIGADEVKGLGPRRTDPLAEGRLPGRSLEGEA